MMLKTLKNEKKYLLLLFIIISLISLIYYLPAIYSKTAYLIGTDLRSQWYEFYYEFRRLIKEIIINHKWPFYSWTTFLGNNFYASKGYYLIGDIYSYIGLFLNDNFFVMAEELTYLKYLVASFTFYLYLTVLERKPTSKLICSLAYALSAYAIYFSEQMVFQSFYSFIPLYLMGIEIYLKDNKKIIFTLSCALLFATNYYLFYTLAALTPLYFTYRYFSLYKEAKGFVKSAFILILFFVLGSLITAFIWLPSLIYMLDSNRVSSSIEILHSPFVYANYIISFFFPNYIYLNRGNMFDTWAYYNREICTWASTLLLVLVPQFISLYDKTRKRLTLSLYGIYLLIACLPVLCMLLHGFSNPSFRWVFIIIITNLFVASEVLDNLDMLNLKLIKKTIIAYTLLIVCAFVFGFINSSENITSYKNQIIYLGISIVTIVLSYYLYKTKNIKLITAFVIIEITISGFYFFYKNIKDGHYIANEYAYRVKLQNYYGEVNDRLKALDEQNGESGQFYRVYVDQQGVYDYFSYNLNIIQGIKGVATYDSTLAPSFNKMKKYVLDNLDKTEDAYLDWIIDITDYDVLNFLNTKYAIVTKEYAMDLDNWQLVTDSFADYYCLYKNKNYVEFGVSYKDAISESEYLAGGYNQNALLHYVIVEDEELDSVSNYVSDANIEINFIDYGDNHLNAEYISDNDSFMVLSIPYDEGWSIYIDGQEVDYYNVNFGFIGLAISKGQHTITMNFVPKGLKMGLVLSGTGLVMTLAYLVYVKRKQKQASKSI